MRREGEQDASDQRGERGVRRRRSSRQANGRAPRRPDDGATARGSDDRKADDRDVDGGERARGAYDDLVADEGALDGPLFGEQGAALFEAVRPHLRAIALAAIGAVLVAGAWNVVSAQRTAARRQSWDAYLEAMNGSRVDALADVGTRFPGSPAAAWARLALAENALGEGTELSFVDKDGARIRLEAAANQYTELLNERPQGLLAERATLGLAKSRESLGQLEEARAGYEAVAKDHPFSPVAEIAAEHARLLGQPQSREWYGWFTEWKPPAQTPPGGVPGGPGADVVPPRGSDPGVPVVPAASTPVDSAAPGTGAKPVVPAASTPVDSAAPGTGAKPAE